MRIFNADGSEAEMCGNGLRCFIKYLAELGIYQDRYRIETLAGTHIAWRDGEEVCVEFPPPRDLAWNICIEGYTLHHLNTGVPHAVIFAEQIDKIDIMKQAPLIRHHPYFPRGTNVNFVDPKTLQIRTFERGVEGETLACGTGAIASALAASKIYHLSSPICMKVKSGERLTISFTARWKTVVMKGPACKIGEGIFQIKEKTSILSRL